MRIGILGQPCIDEIVLPSQASPARANMQHALGGVLYSFAAMERLMRDAHKSDTFVPISWLSIPDRPVLTPLLKKFERIEKHGGFWASTSKTNRVQLVYKEEGSRTEHCSHILPPLTEKELSPDLLESLDGLFVNMISGYDVSIDTLELVLNGLAKRPFVHLDIHALILGPLSQSNGNDSYGGGREPRRVSEWKRWLAIADSVQMNELEARWLADPDIRSEGELLQYIRQSNEFPRLRYLVLTRAERGATLYDWNEQMVYNAVSQPVVTQDTTGSGDVFGAAFLFSLMRRESAKDSLQHAVSMASWNTTLTSIEQIVTEAV